MKKAMMINFITINLLFLILVGCAHSPKKSLQDNEVTLETALKQAQMSYLRGCVESFRELHMAPSFDHCVEKARAHRLELDQIMEQD